MIAIGAMITLLLLSFFLLFVFCRPRWESFRSRTKQQLIFLGGIHVLLMILLAYAAWPLLPAGQAQRSEAIEAFLSNLREGDTLSAISMIVPAPEEEIAVIQTSLSASENRPVSWEVTEPNSKHYAFGEATFTDGQTLDLFIGLEWEWEKARWGITLLEFGREISTSKARFYLYSTFPALQLVSWWCDLFERFLYFVHFLAGLAIEKNVGKFAGKE